MKRNELCPNSIFNEIGEVAWSPVNDAFVVKTKQGATLIVSPNSEIGVPSIVHIDEIEVPLSLRRRGVATKAMTALCQLADSYHFSLEGGPMGLSCDPWRDRFAEWVFRFGFRRHRSASLPRIEGSGAIYVRRMPHP